MDNSDVGDDTKGGIVVQYSGGDHIRNIPTRHELLSMNDMNEENAFIIDKVEKKRPLIFMPHDILDGVHFKNNVPYYAMDISGNLPNGFKIMVKVINFKPYLDVWVPQGIDEEEFRIKFSNKYATEYSKNFYKAEIIMAKPCKYYSLPKPVCRLYFINTTKRLEIIKNLQTSGYETASDDSGRNTYFRTVAKVKDLRLCEWMGIKQYEITKKQSYFTYEIIVDIENISNIGIEKIDELVAINPINRMYYKERSILMTWDIETYSDRPGGNVPMPEFDEDDIFMLCCTFHWKDSVEPLLQICLVDVATSGDTRWVTVECGNSANILLAFRHILMLIYPDYIAGFNDTGYDWPFVIEKAHKFNIYNDVFPDNYRWKCNRKHGFTIKCSADDYVNVDFMHIFGIIPIDVRIYYKKLYPKGDSSNSSSLKYYLRINNLPSKADMPINLMHSYYRAAKAKVPASDEHMRHVAYYCVVDALRCQQLLVKRNVINEVRDICNLANEYIFNGFIRAGGSRVNNLLGREFNKLGYLTTSISAEVGIKEKYQGAYVFPPERGISPNPLVVLDIEHGNVPLHMMIEKMAGSRPTVGLDFESLYPSIIITYNLSPEKMIHDEEEANRLMKSGVDLNYICFDYGGSVIRAWSIKHKNDPEMIGIYPTVLTNLKNHRKKIKEILNEQESIKEAFSLAMAISRTDNVDIITALDLAKERQPSTTNAIKFLMSETEAEVKSKHDRACYLYVMANAKQSAVKVYMNTFYGEAGNPLSPLFKLALAGGVTYFGRKTIKMVADYVREKGFRIKYGDTDSLYLEAPGSVFADCDADFLNGGSREKWYSDQVEITMVELKRLQKDVNQFLINDNGSPYLKMNFEEVMYPVVFCGKKKYYGIAHVGAVNFMPDHLFIRGIDIIKQGQSDISKKVGTRIMSESMSINNNKTMLDIVKNTIQDLIVNSQQWNFQDFIMSYAYKPHKQNIAVNKFIKRMQIILANMDDDDPMKEKYKIPEAGDRFNYVIVKRNVEYSMRGNLVKLGKSDIMEFVEVAADREIDLEYYIERLILGICTRFVSGDPLFNSSVQDMDDSQAEYDDKKTQGEAKSFLRKFIKSITNSDRTIDRARGAAFRVAYKIANAEYLKILKHTYGDSKVFSSTIMRYLIEMDDIYEITKTNFIITLKELASENISPIEEYINIKPLLDEIFYFKKPKTAMHYDMHLSMGKFFQNEVITDIENTLGEMFDDIIKLLFIYKQNLQHIIDKCRVIVANSRNLGGEDDDNEDNIVGLDGITEVVKMCKLKDMPENAFDIAFNINVLWERIIIYSRISQIYEAITLKFRDELAYKPYGGVYSKKEVGKIIDNAAELLSLTAGGDNFNI
jgi:DNA polymerase elongation subunit (family B)